VPYIDHTTVLRYDTSDPGGFCAPTAWETCDPHAIQDPVGTGIYAGAVADERYVYFTPEAPDGEFLRYDTEATFCGNTSWLAFDPGENGVGADPDGYWGGVFDGRYVYFAPHHNGTDYHGEVLRYDTTAPFDGASAWSVFDVQNSAPPGAKGGYSGAVFDGLYVYFVPFYESNDEPHGEVLRYDTREPFATASSWDTFDYGENCAGECTDPDGYAGAVVAGQYVYFAPYKATTTDGHHGEVLRYDTLADIPAVSEWGLAALILLLLTCGTLVLTRRRAVPG
jgi:hypothetical protein